MATLEHTKYATVIFSTYFFAYLTQSGNGSRGPLSRAESGPLISSHSFVMFTGKSAAVHVTEDAAEKYPLSLRANGGSHIPCGPACSLLPSASGDNSLCFQLDEAPCPSVDSDCYPWTTVWEDSLISRLLY
ncbi:unnamed protein product [Pleuronectes platessa]|uniref:Uncharacterized protein n=1 Tax=Pleuronectes platessa TaxID=8262 RepID=A0A9N7VWF8_PLEPL|nr:unnamed protein product [Pleuronectes platessa]